MSNDSILFPPSCQAGTYVGPVGPQNVNVLTFSSCPAPALSLGAFAALSPFTQVYSSQGAGQLHLQGARKHFTANSSMRLGKMSALQPEPCYSLGVVIAGSSALPYKWV